MAAQSSREQEVRDKFERVLADLSRPTPLQQWLANVRIPPADEVEQGA